MYRCDDDDKTENARIENFRTNQEQDLSLPQVLRESAGIGCLVMLGSLAVFVVSLLVPWLVAEVLAVRICSRAM